MNFNVLFDFCHCLFYIRRHEITGGHNLDDTQVSACVLADVQQRQAQELESILLEMQYQVGGKNHDRTCSYNPIYN